MGTRGMYSCCQSTLCRVLYTGHTERALKTLQRFLNIGSTRLLLCERMYKYTVVHNYSCPYSNVHRLQYKPYPTMYRVTTRFLQAKKRLRMSLIKCNTLRFTFCDLILVNKPMALVIKVRIMFVT